jgi:hypothetical protein
MDSNTMFFEQQFGFTAILIEGIKELYDILVKNRPFCKCYDKVISCYDKVISTNNTDVEFYVNGVVSGIKGNMTDYFIKKWHKKKYIPKSEYYNT